MPLEVSRFGHDVGQGLALSKTEFNELSKISTFNTRILLSWQELCVIYRTRGSSADNIDTPWYKNPIQNIVARIMLVV
jgi:hypothetical protein